MASAAILGGGHARRFGGRDKSALVVGGRRIIDRQLQELRQLTDDLLFVGRELPDGVTGVRLAEDRVPGSGPLGGLDAAFTAARDDRLVVVACDMPCVTASFFAALLRLSEADVDVVVPETERGYHPLCAVYKRTSQAIIVRRLGERRLTLMELLDDLKVHVVDRNSIARLGGEQVLTNVNTPSELRDLEALLGHEL